MSLILVYFREGKFFNCFLISCFRRAYVAIVRCYGLRSTLQYSICGTKMDYFNINVNPQAHGTYGLALK